MRCSTAGDLLRNFGGPNVRGLRGAYERLLKLGYGLSVLATVPIVMMPFHAALLPVLARLGGHRASAWHEQIVTTAVIGASGRI